MENTSYLGLRLPAPEDYYDVADWNANSEIIDQYAETVDGTLVQIQGAITALSGGVKLKGAVNHYTDLPSSGQQEGDAYTVRYSGTSGTEPLGVEYAWATYEGTAQWIPLGVDPTYYAKAADLAAQAAALAEVIDNGPKNIAGWTATTTTLTDVTFTVNANGTVTTTASGNAGARRMFPLDFTVPATLPSGRYHLNGCPAGGKSGTTIKYCLYFYDLTAGARVVSSDDTGDGFFFDWVPNPAHTYRIMVDIRSGTNPNGLTFQPMICSETAWNASHKYVAYAPTNAQLYAMIQAQT